MAKRCRALDWSKTPLGPVESWPVSLRAIVSMLLASRHPMFLWWGPELIQIYNDAYRPSLGQSGRDPVALGARGRESWTDIWPTIGPQIEGVMARGESVWFEDAYIPIERNGRLEDVWWTYSYSPVRDDEGRIAGTLVVCTETTGRVIAETNLRDAKKTVEVERARLAETFRLAPSFFAVLRAPEYRFEYANEAYYGLIGRRDIIGKTLLEALPEVASQGFTELLDQVLQTGEPFTGREVPVRLSRGSGAIEERFVDFVYQAIAESDGIRSGAFVHGYDVTDHVMARRAMERGVAAYAELEAQLRAVQDVSPDASLLCKAIRDRSGQIVDFQFTYANRATQRVLLGRDEDLVGRSMREMFPESVAAGRLERYANVVETGEMWLEDVQYTRGSISHGLRVTAVKVGDGVHINAVDLSERFRAAEERERLLAAAEHARKDAESANRAKSEFLAVMSHELRTPLNAIDGYAELMEMEVHGPLTEQQRQDVLRIRKSQRHLLGLINGVLNYTRVEAGVAHYNIAPVSLADVLASCDALMRPQMEHRGLTFAVDMCKSDLIVLADAEKLQQVILNLLTNASKFTAAGGHVRLFCEATETMMAITVADTGRGIAKEQADRIFEPFVQVDARLTRTEEGVGLGLAISRDLAHGMGGEISLKSELGKGSAFTVTIPRLGQGEG
jgi:signal transduction histidine kinase